MTETDAPQLSPTQQSAYDRLDHTIATNQLTYLFSGTGDGKTTLLRRLHQQHGGTLLSIDAFVDAAAQKHPLALEEALHEVLFGAVQQDDLVLVDDFHLATAVMEGGCRFYPRAGLLDAPMTALLSYVFASGKRLVLGGGDRGIPKPVRSRCRWIGIGEFEPQDYAHFGAVFLGPEASGLDYAKIHRFAPRLNVHQLESAFLYFAYEGGPTDTDTFIDYLRDRQLASNVSLDEVEAVDLRSLKGIDDVIESLEANVVLPLEDDELAEELQLKAKRGVLLVGPPGTGKTTVGRALAHRLRGKFFLVDGTCISGTDAFYHDIARVFESAKENAPSVIFIDDSDVIFESGEEHGLYRYLLTMLDGLESKSVGRVCVMLTAMDVGNLPPALIRSGRVELWLETRLPDARARLEILTSIAADLPTALKDVELGQIVRVTNGFTGADLKRTIEDGKALYAYDRSRGKTPKPVTDYFVDAVQTVSDNKARYAQAEARALEVRGPDRPPWFQPVLPDDESPVDGQP